MGRGRRDLPPPPGLLSGADALVHLAWALQPSRDLTRIEEVNVAGTRRVVTAAADAGVGAVVHASSVGAYSAGPKDRSVDESWPTGGVPTSSYSRQKAAVERWLDGFEHDHPALRIVRLRPSLIFQAEAAAEIARLFMGPLVPRRALNPLLLRLLPDVPGLRTQIVHAADVADAYRRAVLGDVCGAFNVAADPPVDARTLAGWLRGVTFPLPARAARSLVQATWRARLQPTEPGWLDLALAAPIQDTARARRQLGWAPTRSPREVILELLNALSDRRGGPTPPLDRQPRKA